MDSTTSAQKYPDDKIRSIVNLAEQKQGTIKIGNFNYWPETKELVKLPITKEQLICHELQSVVDYCNSIKGKDLLVTCAARKVEVFSELDEYLQRSTFLKAEHTSFNFQFGNFMDLDTFIIFLQSQFKESANKTEVLKYCSNIDDSVIKNAKDDGFSQSTTIKKSAATLAEVKVPNPVKLIPKRTFSEIEQPETDFILRLKKTPQDDLLFALFEADGGDWYVQSVKLIKAFIKEGITNKDKVTIL